MTSHELIRAHGNMDDANQSKETLIDLFEKKQGAQWHEESERNSRYFLSLEKKF